MEYTAPALEERLERHIRRLEQRLARLRALDGRFSLYRLAAFIIMLGLLWAAARGLHGLWSLAAAGTGVLLFIGVLAAHRLLDGRTARLQVWRDRRSDQLARLRIDWPALRPEQAPPALQAANVSQTAAPACSSLALDLDLSGARSLHHLLDTCTSQEGRRLLAAWLTQSIPCLEETAARQAVVGELAGMPHFRDHLRLNLHLAAKDLLQSEYLLKWLSVPLDARRLGWLALGLSLLAALNICLFILHSLGQIPAYWGYTLALYAIITIFSTGYIQEFIHSLLALERELDKFSALLRYLQGYPYGSHPHLAQACAAFHTAQPPPSAQVRRVKLVTALVGLSSNFALGMILNLALPWNVLCALAASRLRQKAAAVLPGWIEAWQRLDALCALGDFAALHPQYTFAELDPQAGAVLEARQLGHPLIPPAQRVNNDFSLPELGQVILITGSNMAGKSTWLRALGANLCLAYAGAPVAAEALRLRPMRLHTCLRISDSLVDGFSYFYAEVKCLKGLLEALNAQHPLPLFYLVDEIFRGTNNRERLIGSRAYVQALLNGRGAGLIATHDLELAHLAEQSPHLRNYHFRDQVEGGRLVFDYRLRPGPSPTTNALKIMQMEGLPVELEEKGM